MASAEKMKSVPRKGAAKKKRSPKKRSPMDKMEASSMHEKASLVPQKRSAKKKRVSRKQQIPPPPPLPMPNEDSLGKFATAMAQPQLDAATVAAITNAPTFGDSYEQQLDAGLFHDSHPNTNSPLTDQEQQRANIAAANASTFGEMHDILNNSGLLNHPPAEARTSYPTTDNTNAETTGGNVLQESNNQPTAAAGTTPQTQGSNRSRKRKASPGDDIDGWELAEAYTSKQKIPFIFVKVYVMVS